jgi:hypothetical protein
LTQRFGRPRLGSALGSNTRMPIARNPLQTAVAVVGGAALVAVGVAFSVVIVAAVAVFASVGFGVLWWKSRALRKQLQAHLEGLAQSQAEHGSIHRQPMPQDAASGDIIEGEIIREERETSH